MAAPTMSDSTGRSCAVLLPLLKAVTVELPAVRALLLLGKRTVAVDGSVTDAADAVVDPTVEADVDASKVLVDAEVSGAPADVEADAADAVMDADVKVIGFLLRLSHCPRALLPI